MKTKRTSYYWLAEPLENRVGFNYRRMFGADACYLEGKLVLVFSEGDEPWNGMMVPADKDNHSMILEQYPQLINHEILPKWLYLSSDHEQFEELGKEIVTLILEGDSRFGTIPKPKIKKRKKCKQSSGVGINDSDGKRNKNKGKRTNSKLKPLADGRPPYLE